MSQSLRAVKRFRLRELVPSSDQVGPFPTRSFHTKTPSQGGGHRQSTLCVRQAELIKHARASGTLHLLPPGPKMSSGQLAVATTTAAASAASAASTHHPAADRAAEEVTVSGLTNRRPAQQEAREDDAAWKGSVEWVGSLRERSVAGADVGNRLYAGKKRMFKGHKWERTRERRITRTKILLRDMDKRVERFKQYRAKGKPLPLARRSNLLKKTQKLPF
ncbi:hypothetical protein EDB85DRAFT_2139114 [Lactarius pseudohatsudake]|nr:hypothetical protein EDB85DRAFT_2139114 [Lactarius pseudohatsudake]